MHCMFAPQLGSGETPRNCQLGRGNRGPARDIQLLASLQVLEQYLAEREAALELAFA
jgi:hypothetical protein